MIVGAEEIERRIEEPRLVQADEDRIGAVLRPESAIAEPRSRAARSFFPLGDADFRTKSAAALEDAQDVARLADLESRQRIEIRDDAAIDDFALGRRRVRLNPLRRAGHAVAFAVMRILGGNRAVVVKRGTPQHAAVGHHALADFEHLSLMAEPAAHVRHAEIARIDESDELGRLVVQKRVGADRLGTGGPGVGEAGKDVRAFLRISRRIAAVAIAAAQPDRGFGVHVA